jgi:hypothetical protein
MRSYLIFALLLFLSYSLSAQTFLVNEEFNSGTTAPSGWTFTSIAAGSSSVSNYGQSGPSINFNDVNDRVVTPTFSGADQLSFWVKSSSGTPPASDYIRAEALVSGVWTSLGDFQYYTTARTVFTTLPAGSTQVRLTSFGSSENAYVDDLKIRSATACTTGSLYIAGIMADACGGDEGYDEWSLIVNQGPAMNVSDLEYHLPDGGNAGVSTGTTYCGTASNAPCNAYFTANTNSYIANLNSVAGCTIFAAPPGNVIPSGANFMIFHGRDPNLSTYDFNDLCGQTIYALFTYNTNDNNGRLGNRDAGCSGNNCPRRVAVRNLATGCYDENGYDRGILGSPSGSYVEFDFPGDAPGYQTSSCNTFTPLPVKWLYLNASSASSYCTFEWACTETQDLSYYALEASADGIHFQTIEYYYTDAATLSAQVNQALAPMARYFRVAAIEKDGKAHYSPIATCGDSEQLIKLYSPEANVIEINNFSSVEGMITLFNLEGVAMGTYLIEPNSVKQINLSSGLILYHLHHLQNLSAGKLQVGQD